MADSRVPAGRDSLPDVGSVLARLLARPLAAFSGTTVQEIRRQVSQPPTSINDILLSALTRCVTWLFSGVICLGVAFLVMAVEDLVADSDLDVTSLVVWPPTAICFVAGILSALRLGVAHYVSEERWRRAGCVLRWIVTPGNRDLAIAAVLVAFVGVAIATS